MVKSTALENWDCNNEKKITKQTQVFLWFDKIDGV